MIAYSYDRITRIYVGTTYADPDPMQPGQFLFAAFTTHKEPPPFVAGKRCVFNVEQDAWMQEDVPPEPVSAPSEIAPDDYKELMRIAVERYLNAVAVGFKYNSIDAAVSYADEPAVSQYQAEGRALRAWRSRVWQAFYLLLAQIDAGEVPRPTSDFVLFDLLPKITAQDVADALAALTGGDGGA